MKNDGDELEHAISDEARGAIEKEQEISYELVQLQSQLADNPLFAQFLQKQAELKLVQSKTEETWKRIEDQMIAHDIKSIKGDFGSITIAERLNWKVEDIDKLPRRFVKKVPDTKKISEYYRLEDKVPAGAEPYMTKYLMKRIKL